MTPGQRRERALSWLAQLALLGGLAALGWWLASNAVDALRARGIQAGFDFLLQPAGFDIGEAAFETDAAKPLWLAFLAGIVNTLRVAVPALVLTTLWGLLIGVGRVSTHRLVNLVCTTYVEAVRNVPLLVLLLMVYFVITHSLPSTEAAWQWGHSVYLSTSGLSFPWPVWPDGGWWPTGWDWPEPDTFNIHGGARVTPEYLAVLVGLVLYTAAFVAEIVRAGIQAVPEGQVHAAQALGLRRLQQLRWIILPQALRVMVPSLGNQYLNLVKNSTLGVAVGYPELVSIANTTLNQTGRAFECVAILMSVYLTLSLTLSGLINLFNRRVALRGHA